ncbi:hypothetical protein Tco_0600474 [Tanacetum coccineum]|uniref:Uncharacterized protein n=1 Tax=Tanacetum coccineum TaxID=301880 RepID=A0ABQ4WC07_9ASTR
MTLPNEYQLTFNQYVDAQSMFAVIKARFGGNEATKRTQKALLKQQYKNFNASSSESLDSIFNRLQKLVSRLAILGVVTPPEDLNRFYGGSDEEPSDVGSPRVTVYRYDGLRMYSVAPPSLVYVPGPEHPPSPDYVPGLDHPPSPVYVPELEYPEYLVPSGDEAPIEDQPLPADASPTALSTGYVADFDPEEDPKEDPEEDHPNYPADGRDGDDESSDGDDDDADDEDEEEVSEDKDDEDEEEEHLASADSSVILVVDPVPSVGDTKAFETDNPTYAEAPLGYREARIRIRAASPPLLLPSTSHRTDIPEAEMLLWKRACFTTPAFGFELRPCLEYAPTTLEGVNQRVTKLATTVKQDTNEFYVRFEDAQDDRAFLKARVNALFRDRRFHHHTTMLLDREATYARRAWTSSKDRSASIEAHVRTLEARVATLMAQTSSLQTQLTTTLRRS